MHPQVLEGATLMHVIHPQLAQLVSAQRVLEQDRQDRAIEFRF